MNENKRKLYDALSAEYDLGTYEEFERNIGDGNKRRKLFDAASADYDLGDYETYSQKIGPTHKESLDLFNAEHGSFLDDFEARDSAERMERRMAAADAMMGIPVPSGDGIAGEERARYQDLRKQEEALKKAWYTSDEYLEQKDAEALQLSQMRDSIRMSRSDYANANPMLDSSASAFIPSGAAVQRTRGAEADREMQMYDTASRIMDDAIKMHNAPSKFDGKNVFLKFGKGAGDTLSNVDFWSMGLTEIADNLGVREVLSSVQDKLGNLNDLSEEAIENILTPAEKAVLQAWAVNAQEQAKRREDLSRAYQGGQGAVESLGFMAEFALTGGIGKAATEGVETMAKWLGKKALTTIGGKADDVAEKIIREAGEKIASNTAGKYAKGLAESLSEAAGRTGVMPSSFRNITEKATEIQTDEAGNNYLVGMNEAFARGFADSFIENLSEGGRVGALGELIGDVAGKIPAYRRMLDKFSHTKASELLRAFNSSGIMNTLRAGGWHGFGEEYLEEWYGNALRTLTGVDKDALKEFATVDNQIVTLTSFLPMTIFGGTVSTAQVLSAKRDLDKKAEALRSALLERGYDEAQADNMIDMMRGASPAEVSETLSPIVNSVAGRNVNEASALMMPVGEFAMAVQRWQAFDTKYQYQEQEQRDDLRSQMESTIGQFWQEDENGRQTVQRGVNSKGEAVYLLGKPSAEEAEAGIASEVAAVSADGRKMFVNPSEYQLEDELEMNDFLGTEIMSEKRNKEQARMIEEKEAQIAAIRQQAVPGTAINIGTAEAPAQAVVIQRNPDGVIVNTPDGQTRLMTYEEFGNYVGINAVPLTDAQIDEQEADALSADRAQMDAALDQEYGNDDAALSELNEAETEIEQSVAEATPLPTKSDGSVDQNALWNTDPARWAQWNDEQRQDGGVNSLGYINGAIAREEAAVAELTAAYDAEPDFDTRASMEQQIAANTERLQRLVNLRDRYIAQAEAVQAVAEEVAAEQVAPRISSQMSEQEKVAMDAQHQVRLDNAKSPRARREALQNYINEISEGSEPMFIISVDDYEEVMGQRGCSPRQIAQVRAALAAAKLGRYTVPAFFVPRVGTFAFQENIQSVEDARLSYVHERQHKFTRGNNAYVNAILNLGLSRERMAQIVYALSNSDFYKDDSAEVLADEIISYAMERAYTYEDFSVALQELGIEQEIIDIITNIDNEQRNEDSTYPSRRRRRYDLHDNQSNTGNGAENDRNQEPVSGGLLGSQGDRSFGDSDRRARSTGEGAEVISEEQLNAPNSGEASQITAADGEVIADTDGNGKVRFSIRTWLEGGRDYLAAWLAKDTTLADDEKADILARMDEFYQNASLYSDTYVPFGTWSEAGVRYDGNGNPLMSVIKANGDYAMNLDFSLVCKKRRPLNRLLRTLVNRNAFSSYTLRERELAEINWILQEHGFEVACALCFVDSKRYRVTGVADVFASLYNSLVKSIAPKGVKIGHFNYSNNPNVEKVEDGLDTLPDEQLNWAGLDKALKGKKEGSVEYKVAQYLREHPQARRLVDATDFIEAEGFESVKENNPDLLKFYNMKKGTGGPKASFGDVQYLNDILKNERAFSPEKAYAVGGVRLQSFSDFVPHMYFDYMQLFAELAAKKLPVHAYTKEVLFAKIFGLTGAKINLSLVPAVVEGGVAPGLDAEGNYAWADPIRDTEDNIIQQGQTFPFDEAMAIQNAEGYSKNCGAIAVGISDAHIEKMLDDPNIQFIIPYHKSSLNAIVARMTNIDKYKDYTNVQNTRKATGSKLDKGTKDFNFNEHLHNLGESGTPQQAAQAYLDWCRENGFVPKFSQFAYHPNYYKLLVDFNTIDTTTGEYAPQGAVSMTFPTEQSAFGNVETLIQQGLQEDAELEEKLEAEINSIADQVLARLAEIAKEPKMTEKQQARKMAEIADERMARIRERASGTIDILEEARKVVEREDGVAFRVISQENYDMAERIISNLAGRPYFQRVEGEYELGKLASNYAELADIIMAIDANGNYTPVGTALLGFFAENPDMHFPLLFNDSAVGKETSKAFAEELSKVNDPFALYFMKEAWKIHKGSLEQAGLGVKPSSTTKYNKAIDARAEEIKAAEVKGTAFNFKRQESSLDEIDAIFKQLNKDEDLALLHDRVMNVARTLGVKVSFAGKRGSTAGESLGDKVSYDYKFFNSPAVSDQKKCNTITHELIHSVTVYAIYLRSKAPSVLSDGMLEAVDILHDVYNQIARDPAFKGEYGVTDVYEMVAELSNAQFRDKLKEKNLFQRILDALKRLLGIYTVKEDSAYQVLSDTLNYIIDNYDQAAFDAYALYASKSKSYGRMMKIEEAPRFRITPEQDKAYMDAVNAGDLDTAQRMVDEAADRVMKNSKVRDSQGKLIRVTHYSPNEFTSFDPQKIGSSTDWGVFGRGFYFSNKDHRLYGKNRYEGYLNLENPFIINGGEEAYAYKEAIADFAGVQYYEVGKKETDDYTDYLISQGYDGVIYNDTFSGFNEYVAFYPYQFKLADVVDVETKDDNGNVIPLSERFNPENEDIRFRFIGKMGAANLDKAEEATIRLDNLAVAKKMEKAGKDARDIKFATGWERGADRLWRYEEPDFWIDGQGEDYLDQPTERKSLSEYVDKYDWEYFVKAYPELSDLQIEITEFDGYGGGYYDPFEHLIVLRPSNGYEFNKGAIMHEVQHAIQEVEGFASGTNPEMFADAWLYGLNTDTLLHALRIREQAEAEVAVGRYKRIGNAINHAAKVYDYLAGESVDKEESVEVAKYRDSNELYKFIVSGKKDAERKYLRTAGEVEARNVEERYKRGWGNGEYLYHLAEETEDVARKDQIFLEDALTAAMPSDVRFRMSNENQAIFVSNAARAVEGIKQEKATPEQWLKMIEKNGGLKAGEDKWMGLSDWLKASDKKTLTKAEVLDFINENMIVIEEQHYSDEEVAASANKELNDKYPGWEDAFSFEWDSYMDEPYASIWDTEVAVGLYNDYHEDQIELDEDGEFDSMEDEDKVAEFGKEIAEIYYRGNSAVRPINGIRSGYQTRGLKNNREIALTVPSIESWAADDVIHFGDAGNGRAIAWIRFGETEVTEEGSLMDYEPKNDVERDIKSYIEYAMRNGDDFNTSVGYAYNQITDAPSESVGWTEEAVTAVADGMRGTARTRKILVIDEIQSNRHQEGREKGYKKSKAEIEQYLSDNGYEVKEDGNFYNFYKNGELERRIAKGLMHNSMDKAKRFYVAALNKDESYNSGIPDAPFDKNWHELAMKRMLRYAAENGYDVIAWTTGDQQASRYDLSKMVKKISVYPSKDGSRIVDLHLVDRENDFKNLIVDSEGMVTFGEFKGRALADIVGKDYSMKIMAATRNTEFSGDNLQVGGEGMRGFYDKMLPAFMNKYGKKWGVKVEDIDLPNLGRYGYTMHSVPVTEEMKASVMEGQVMFRVRGENESAEEFVNGVIEDFKSRYTAFNDILALDPTSKEQLADFIGMPVDKLSDEMMADLMNRIEERDSRAWFNPDTKRIAIFVRENVRDGKKSELVLIHENIHAINKKHNELIAIGEYLWNSAKEGTREYRYKTAITEAYPESEWFDEMSAYVVSEYIQDGEIDVLKGLLDAESTELLDKLLKYNGNGKERARQRPRISWNVLRERSSDKSEESRDEGGEGQSGDLRFRATEITPEVRDEMNVIAATAIVNGNYMKAPNGADTNLTPEQWAMVRTKSFREWFGDWENDPGNASKVVDENGEPKVVFHGGAWRPLLEEKGNAVFKMRGGLMGKGAYFTDMLSTAIDYAREKYGWEHDEEVSDEFLDDNGYIAEVFLNIRNEDNIREYYGETYYLATNPSQIKSATGNTGEFADGEGDIRFSIRTKPAPEKTGVGYKVFYLKDGKLYPPMVANQGGVDTPVGVWLDAEEGTRAGESKTGRPQVKQGGKGTQGGSGKLAYRPGWHLGEIPYALQFNRKDESGEKTLFPADFVWAEVEYANDVDYQEEAMSYGYNANGKFQHSLAGLPKLPTDGSYRYRTNPNPETDPWIITGAMKVNRLLTPSEVDQMVIDAGREPQKRQEGAVTDEQIQALNESFDIRYRVNENPTDAQKEAGNYKKGHLNLDGYRITIENPKGSVRRGTDSNGNTWENTLNNDYGYIRGTEGVDGDHIDVYLSDNPSEGNVFVIDQVNPSTREFDEHKVMYGFNSAEEAREAYLANYSEGWNGLGTITEVTKDEFKKWIESSHRKTKPFSEYKSVKAIGAQSEAEEAEDDLLPSTGTPTDEVVASGLDLSPAQTAELAGNIFAALPEESRKKITEGLNGNILGLQDAILQIPTSLASKENWDEEDRQMADIVAEEMTKMAGDMTRPFSASEGLWLLYNNLNKNTDLISQASRALVRRNLGFDAETLAMQEKAKDGVRFRTVGDASANAQASMYNRGAANVWTRLKESFVDMNASVEKLVKAIEKRSGKVAQGFENVLMAMNQQSSKGLAAMEEYEQKFLNPMFDEIRDIMNKTDFKYEDIVRYVILKHGLERNVKLAQRDARAHYQEIYDDIIAKIKGMNPAQKRTYLTNAQLRDADAKAELARLQGVNTSVLTPDQLTQYKKDIAKAKKEAAEAAEHLVRAQKIAAMTEQDAQNELDKIFDNIDNESDSVYKEMRKNDYSGISSMFYDTLGVDRKNYATEEEYQAALMQAKADKYDTLGDIEGAAQTEVTLFENKVNTDKLWKSINNATKKTLRQQYEANMISQDQYRNLRDMFEFYVPLRGFKDNTAEDMYTYYRRPNSTGYTKPILGAEGRKTEAESPFGWIAAMAGSAIASNVKNEAKLALYYFVSNRPDNGVAMLSKTWFVHTPGDVDANGKKIFRPAYPPFNEDLSSASGKADYEIWQANMKSLQKQGLAYEAGQRLNLGNSVVNISDANKPEHIVNVKVGGKDYTIVINGNPRAAQAINGDLNIESSAQDYGAVFGPMLRWMSSVNTSYNPEFWITNMMRDLAFTMMAVNIKEDPAYRRKFKKNYVKAFKVVSMVAKNENGTLGNSYIERMYKDFVKYGGVTGYTQIKDSETWEREIEGYLKSNAPGDWRSGKVMRGMKSVFHVLHRFGESLEQVSRFAAFLTAVETGKSINEAINDAKEITVNFNRKGSGKMITLEEAKYLTDKNGQPLNKFEQWAAVGLSSIAPLGRRFIMFFNAAIQGLNATYKLYAKNKTRAIGWALGYAAVGMMNAVLHAMLDDDDDYLDIPQYERRNSLMIGGNGAYFKWALPQEARAFYALGDLAVESVMGRNPHQNVIGEALKISTELLPINPSEGWKAFMPSVSVPLVELVLNEDYKGAPIYNEQKWLTEEERKRSAKWSKAYQGTGDLYVGIARGLNALTGGDKYDAGIINLQPEKMEHIVQSAFGGTIRTADKLINTIMAAFDPEEDVTVRQFPFLNRFLTINDERFKNVHVNDVYDYYKADAEHALTLEKQYKKDNDSKALSKLRESDEYKWAQIYSKYKKPIKNIQEKIKVASGTAERKELMKQQDELKKNMIKEISDL